MLLRRLLSPRHVFFCVSCLAALVSGSASAAGALSELDADSPMARYRAAYESMNAGEWLEARRLLLSLWNKSRTYDVAASLGQVEYQLLNFVAAARYMSFAIANVAPKEKYQTLERYRAALEEIRVWVGTIEVGTNVAGAEIRVDGELVGRAPLNEPVFVSPGTHVVQASNGSEGSVTRTLAIAAGERVPLVLAFASGASGTAVDADAMAGGTQSVRVAKPAQDGGRSSGRTWMPSISAPALR